MALMTSGPTPIGHVEALRGRQPEGVRHLHREACRGPSVVGVPDSSPVEAFSVRPGGRLPPDTAQVKGPVPPVTESASLYATEACPDGGAGLASEGTAAITSVAACVALPPAVSVILTVKA